MLTSVGRECAPAHGCRNTCNTTETDRSRRPTVITPPAHFDFTGGDPASLKVNRRRPTADQGITTSPTGGSYLKWWTQTSDTYMVVAGAGIERNLLLIVENEDGDGRRCPRLSDGRVGGPRRASGGRAGENERKNFPGVLYSFSRSSPWRSLDESHFRQSAACLSTKRSGSLKQFDGTAFL